jgi:hypothetical protein
MYRQLGKLHQPWQEVAAVARGIHTLCRSAGLLIAQLLRIGCRKGHLQTHAKRSCTKSGRIRAVASLAPTTGMYTRGHMHVNAIHTCMRTWTNARMPARKLACLCRKKVHFAFSSTDSCRMGAQSWCYTLCVMQMLLLDSWHTRVPGPLQHTGSTLLLHWRQWHYVHGRPI